MEQKLIERINAKNTGTPVVPVHLVPPSGAYDPEHDAAVLIGKISSEYMNVKFF